MTAIRPGIKISPELCQISQSRSLNRAHPVDYPIRDKAIPRKKFFDAVGVYSHIARSLSNECTFPWYLEHASAAAWRSPRAGRDARKCRPGLERDRSGRRRG